MQHSSRAYHLALLCAALAHWKLELQTNMASDLPQFSVSRRPGGLQQKPGASLSFVDPPLKETGGSDIFVLVA